MNQIILLSKDLRNLSIIYKNKKIGFHIDYFNLDQYLFLKEKNKNNTIYAYPIACKSNDQNTEIIDI